MSKQFIAWARVSSDRQRKEGFSLEDQEQRLHREAERRGGQIVKLFKLAETASKTDERETFREMIAYARKHSRRIGGILFVRVDRAARNLKDWVALEDLGQQVPILFIDQPDGNSASANLQRRLASVIAAHQTEQQAENIRAGHKKRIESGLPLGSAPFGYRNIRVNGRGLVELHPVNASKVRRIFELYAYGPHTLDSLIESLQRQGIVYSDSSPRFPRSVLHRLLKNRHYLGEVLHQGVWSKGNFEPLIDLATFQRVQDRLGGKVYHAPQMTYAGGLIICSHCGHVITGEQKRKRSPIKGGLTYTYYRCSRYNAPSHPRDRVTEQAIDRQLIRLFKSMQIDQELREWFVDVIRARAQAAHDQNQNHRGELERQRVDVDNRLRRLLDLRMDGEITAEEYAAKRAELQDRQQGLTLQTQSLDRDVMETTDLAIRAFELSQALADQWLRADYAAKRTILSILLESARLNSGNVEFSLRKPFDLLVGGSILEENGAMGI